MDNRWDRARRLRGLDDQPIRTEYEYIGRLNVNFTEIHNDFKDIDWTNTVWFAWNWRVKQERDEGIFPTTDSTRYVNKSQYMYRESPSKYCINYSPFKKIMDDLGLEMPSDSIYSPVKINKQLPGDMLWMHYDFTADDDWERYFVFLNDWGLGQVVLWGEDAITNWKSGDCYKITGTVTPHGAVNCGPTERWLANVRGKPKANRVLSLAK